MKAVVAGTQSWFALEKADHEGTDVGLVDLVGENAEILFLLLQLAQ